MSSVTTKPIFGRSRKPSCANPAWGHVVMTVTPFERLPDPRLTRSNGEQGGCLLLQAPASSVPASMPPGALSSLGEITEGARTSPHPFGWRGRCAPGPSLMSAAATAHWPWSSPARCHVSVSGCDPRPAHGRPRARAERCAAMTHIDLAVARSQALPFPDSSF